MQREVVSAQVPEFAAVDGERGPRGEEQAHRDADVSADAAGAFGEKREQEQTDQASADDGGNGVPKRQRVAVRVGEDRRDDNAERSADGDDEASGEQARAVRGVGAENAVVVGDADGREAVEVRGEVGHGGSEKRGHEEAGEARRDVGGDEVGEDLIGLRDVGGQLFAGVLIEGPAEGSHQHEEGPHRDAEQRAERDAADGCLIAARDQVALHHGLVGGVTLQVVKEAVKREHQDGGPGEHGGQAAEADLVAVPGGGQLRRGSAGGKPEQITEADGDPEPEQETLHDVRPDHRFDAADQGVEHGDDADQDDDAVGIPAGHAGDGEREQIEDEAHLREVSEGVGERAVDARGVPEAAAEILVGGHADGVAEERNDDGCGEGEHRHDHQTGDQVGPVARIGGARVGDERDAADQRGQQGEAHGPAGDAAFGDEVTFGGGLAAGKNEADGDQPHHVQNDDQRVEPAQSTHPESATIYQESDSSSAAACSSSAMPGFSLLLSFISMASRRTEPRRAMMGSVAGIQPPC